MPTMTLPHVFSGSLRTALCLALCIASSAAHAAGLPDRSFANDGAFVSAQPGVSPVLDGLIDSEGRHVLVGGRILDDARPGFIIRLTANGALDASFGGSGEISLAPPPGYGLMELRAVEERPDGRLVVAGHVSPAPDLVEARPIVCRLLETGQPDLAFGDGGCTMPPFGPLSPEELVKDMELQANGRIVLLGTSKFGQTRRPAVMRLLSNGDRDPCFNDPGCDIGGAVIDPALGDVIGVVNALAIAPDQKIVVAGTAVQGQNIDMMAFRLLATGAVDAGFGNGGSRSLAFDEGGDVFDAAHDVAVLADGSIVMAGIAESGDNSFIAAVGKLTPSGVPDIFFGQSGAGRAVTAYTDVSIDSFAHGIAVQADGKLVVGGTSYAALFQKNAYFAAWRLLPNGFSDPSFGTFDGRIVVTLDDGPDIHQVTNAIAIDEGHLVLMGGLRETGADPLRAAVLRLELNGVFSDGFE
jgi:uncharacterized delta-60 repeat protein